MPLELLASAGAMAVTTAGSEPVWMSGVTLLVQAIFTALAGWTSVLVCKVISRVAERAGHRLTVEQEETLHRFLDTAVRAAEETAAAKKLKNTGVDKFAEVLNAAKAKFPALDDDDIKRGIQAIVNKTDGIGASGNTGKP